MLDKVRGSIIRHRLISPNDIVVVGISGGADSTALVECLRLLGEEMRFSIVCAHFNHGMREQGAANDEAFVRGFCSQRGLPLLVEEGDVPLYSEISKLSMETAARLLRYKFLNRAKLHFNANSIAVAHHMDDNAESILMHLIRGSGLSGLTGMKPKRDEIIRPFLDVTRSEIEAFLAEREISYCTDETNLIPKGTRNILRLSIMPIIKKELNPAVVQTICRCAALLSEDDEYLNKLACDKLDECRTYAPDGEDGAENTAEASDDCEDDEDDRFEEKLPNPYDINDPLYGYGYGGLALDDCRNDYARNGGNADAEGDEAGEDANIYAEGYAEAYDSEDAKRIASSNAEAYRSHDQYKSVSFDRRMLDSFERPIKSRAIRHALARAGAFSDIERSHVDNVISLLSSQSGQHLDLPHSLVRVSFNDIIFSTSNEVNKNISRPYHIVWHPERDFHLLTPFGEFESEIFECDENFKPVWNANIAYMDYESTMTPFVVRTRMNGDRFRPVNAPGKCKLKDFFINKKLDAALRNYIPLVVSGGEIAFVPGYCVSEDVKITKRTRRVLRITFRPIPRGEWFQTAAPITPFTEGPLSENEINQ